MRGLIPLGVVVLALAVLLIVACNVVTNRIDRLEAELAWTQNQVDQLDFYFWYDHEERIDKLEED